MTGLGNGRAPWIAHIVFADILRESGTLVCTDPWIAPIRDPLAKLRLLVKQPVHRASPSPHGGRSLLVDRPECAAGMPGPFALVSDSPEFLQDRDERLWAVLSTDASGAPPGFRPVLADYPWLSMRDDTALDIVAKFANRLEALATGVEDALDALQAHCRSGSAVDGLTFMSDGGAVLGFSPLACLRWQDRADAMSTLLRGKLGLERFSPVKVRIPTLMIQNPRIIVDLEGPSRRTENVSVEFGNIAGGLTRLTGSGRQSLELSVKTGHPGYVELTLRGHGCTVTSLGLRLEPVIASGASLRFDPLERFADTLDAYRQLG